MTSSSVGNELDDLFPLPSAPPSPLCPDRFPGIGYATKVALTEALKKDYEERHGFTNEHGFHNHTSHQLLATFAMGAPAALFDAIMNVQVERTLPAVKSSPQSINKDNFYDHIGDILFYDAYLRYFSDIVQLEGAASAVERYIFSLDANFQDGMVTEYPRLLLNRMFGRLYHPMIYVGYGLEFGIPGLVVEGLAQTAVHVPETPSLFSLSEFQCQDDPSAKTTPTVTHITSELASFKIGPFNGANQQWSVKDRKDAGMHAFAIIASILKDARFVPSSLGLAPRDHPTGPLSDYRHVAAEFGEVIRSYAEDWIIERADAAPVEDKIEELCWLTTLLYGVGGWYGRNNSPDGNFNADFFLLHQITSAIFLPAFAAHLSPQSTIALLRTYFMTCLTWWITRGRPAVPIQEFYASTTPSPSLFSTGHVKPGKSTLSPENVTPNPWLPIIQTSIMHPDHHLCKAQRALVHFGSRYGDRPAGHFRNLNSVEAAGLDGIEVLDGTLFARVAYLTAERVGWLKEGQESDFWDFYGFFK